MHLEPSSRTKAELPPYAHQVYCVYINNVTNALRGRLTEGLKAYRPFLGIADVTFASQFKSYLSRCLVSGYVKQGTVVIQPHADDEPPERDENVSGYGFEEHGWSCRSVPGIYYGLLLSYKIEAPVLQGGEADVRLSSNALVDHPSVLASLAVTIDEAKLAYLHQAKGGTLRRLGVCGAPTASLAEMIREKLRSNYIYSLSYSDDYAVAKFNMNLELEPIDGGDPIRTLAAFEYRAEAEQLRLITLY